MIIIMIMIMIIIIIDSLTQGIHKSSITSM